MKYPNNTENGCVPYAISVIEESEKEITSNRLFTEIYTKHYNELKTRNGITPGGTKISVSRPYLTELGYIGYTFGDTHFKVGRIAREFEPESNKIIATKNHVTAVLGAEIVDPVANKNKKVLEVWVKETRS